MRGDGQTLGAGRGRRAALYIAETDRTAQSGLKLCRRYYADRDCLVPDWRLPLGSFVKFSDPWDVEAVTLPDAERRRIETRIGRADREGELGPGRRAEHLCARRLCRRATRPRFPSYDEWPAGSVSQ